MMLRTPSRYTRSGEARQDPAKLFARFDKDSSGALDLQEFNKLVTELMDYQRDQGMGASTSATVRPGLRPGEIASELVKPDVRSVFTQNASAINEMYSFYAKQRGAPEASGLDVDKLTHCTFDERNSL